MNNAMIASAARNAVVLRISETPIVHIIDDDEPMRVVLRAARANVGLD